VDPRRLEERARNPKETIDLRILFALGIAVTVIVGRPHRQVRHVREGTSRMPPGELDLRTFAATVPEILFTATPSGCCDYVNERFSEYAGLKTEEACEAWLNSICPADRHNYRAHWSKSVATGSAFETTYRIRRWDGEYRWFQARAQPVRGAGGSIIGWAGICTDIHEQKLLHEVLARRTAQVTAASEEFQTFAYRVTHDLKEPLRTIGLYSEMLVRRNEDRIDEPSRTATRYISEAVECIERQLQNLLEYSRVGSLELENELVDLNPVLQSAIANLNRSIVEAGATVTYDRLPTLMANPDRIRSVFQNLIGNAIKYRSADPPQIQISARMGRDAWTFAVKDNGMGFEMKDAERIFEAFARAPNSSAVQGSGLGLSIVKRAIEVTGGRVWAESEGGKGSTFFFTLPRGVKRIVPESRKPSTRSHPVRN
jgi:PAS domain S-box-containing protein